MKGGYFFKTEHSEESKNLIKINSYLNNTKEIKKKFMLNKFYF